MSLTSLPNTKCVRIKRSKAKVHKFKVQTGKRLVTLVVDDSETASKLEARLRDMNVRITE